MSWPSFIYQYTPTTKGSAPVSCPAICLAAFGDAGNDGDDAKYGDGPKQQLSTTGFLQVKAGNVDTQKVRPRQKEADAQTDGAEVDHLRSA